MEMTREFADSYKEFRAFFAEMRDYKVAEMRPFGITDAELDIIANYATCISNWARYFKENC